MRKLISDFFVNNSKIEVVGTARNGKDAIKKIQALKPDVVTMDVEMPELNGLDALKEIMNVCPVPVVMLSSTTNKNAENTMIAMENGAVDFVAKPSGTISLDLHKIQNELIHKVEEATKVPISKLQKKPINHKAVQSDAVAKMDTTKSLTKSVASPKGNIHSSKIDTTIKKDWSRSTKKIVLIGTSTGGPRALQEVITKIPKNIQAPILIVQHMPAGFTKSLANRLKDRKSVV